MCRLILARGTFSSARILDAAIAMSCGRTADHDGPIQRHPNGWGAIWRRGGRLAIHRDTRAIDDSARSSPVGELTTDFLAVHVRHATLARNHGAEFTHPVEHVHARRSWYLLHNGFLPTVHQQIGRERSEFDSAEYLEYLMCGAVDTLDLDATRDKLAAIPPGGTSANAFLVNDERVYIIHWTPEDTAFPRYFTMHRLEADGCTIISSEIIESLGPRARWRAMPARTIEQIALAP
jgi:predicted glutamine amidotransferase